MANSDFSNVMWGPRDTLDPDKLAKMQKNSDNIYNYRIYNSRGILAKYIRTTTLAVGQNTTILYFNVATDLTFTVEKNRAIGFGFHAPFIREDSTAGSGFGSTAVHDALPTLGVSIDGETTFDGTGINNAMGESPRSVGLWQTRTNGSIYDGTNLTLYYVNTVLTAGSHNAKFWVRNSTSPSVGTFTVMASTIFPITMWVEDLGANRSYA